MPDEMTTEEYQAELLGRIKERFEEVECLHMISSFLQQLSDEVRETAFINEVWARINKKRKEEGEE